MRITKLSPPDFPPLLNQLEKPPDKLYLAGHLPPVDNKTLCIVGARDYDRYGLDVCRNLVAGLQGYPITIVSGLALGIDSIAHELALEYGLRTISIPGSGLAEKSIYPASHFRLAQKIVESGNALLSPFDPDQEATRWTFPVRNALMAGIAEATLVIQGRQGSGTLLTAGNALDFNRELLAVPGPIFSELSYGPHLLIKRGAMPITYASEILEVLGFSPKAPTPSLFADIEEVCDEREKNIIKALRFGPLSSAQLSQETGLEVSDLNVLLSGLELRGLIHESGEVWETGR